MEYKGYTFTIERDGIHIEKGGGLVIIQLQQLPCLGLNTFEDAIVYFNSIPQEAFS